MTLKGRELYEAIKAGRVPTLSLNGEPPNVLYITPEQAESLLPHLEREEDRRRTQVDCE